MSNKIETMSRSGNSLFVFSLYLFGLGLVLLFTPNILFSLFSIPETKEVWIRVAGMLVFILGFYYMYAARNNLTGFFRATLYARCSVIVFFTLFVLLGLAPPVLILFGAVDLAGAVWTGLCLRVEGSS
jgi:hypothetical protein